MYQRFSVQQLKGIAVSICRLYYFCSLYYNINIASVFYKHAQTIVWLVCAP